jgi:hypothetical protein
MQYLPERMCDDSILQVSLIQRTRQIVQNEGFSGLGRRTMPPLLTNLVTGGVLFGTYRYLYSHSTFHGHDQDVGDDVVFMYAGLAGATAGAAHALAYMPCDLWQSAIFRNVGMVDLIPRDKMGRLNLREYVISRSRCVLVCLCVCVCGCVCVCVCVCLHMH